MKDIRKLNKIVKKVFKNETFNVKSGCWFDGEVKIESLSYKDDNFFTVDGELYYCVINLEIVNVKKDLFNERRFQTVQYKSRKRNEFIRKYFRDDRTMVELSIIMRLVGIKEFNIGKIKMKK